MKHLLLAMVLVAMGVLAKEEGPAGMLGLSDGAAETGAYRWTARVGGVTPGPVAFSVVDLSSGESASIAQAKSLPVNLWVLFDTAAVCGSRKADQMVAQAIEGARRALPAESLLSVVSFTQTTLEIHHDHKAITDAAPVTFRCDPKLLSTSYEKPLLHLFDRANGSSLPLVVWVYSSGNLKVSQSTLSKLGSRNAEVHLVLYNPFLEEEVRPVVDVARASLGDRVQFTVRKDASAWIPDLRYALRFDAPISWQGRTLQTRVEAAHMGGKSVSGATRLSVPRTASGAFWERHRWWLVPTLVTLFLVAIGYTLYRVYRPRRCAKCRRLVRRAEPACGFCAVPEDAYLVGPDEVDASADATRVIPLTRQVTWVGSARRSRVRILKARDQRRRLHAAIFRERLAGGELGFRLVPTGAAVVVVNGKPVADGRLLGAGDEVCIDDLVFTFVTAKEVRHHG